MSKAKILFTGGGTAGHVTPNIALMHDMRDMGVTFHYIGLRNGIEKTLIDRESATFHAISSGKIRRELSFKNLLTPLLVILGIVQSCYILLRVRPQVVFSKGGFVAFPVVVAAWLLRIPVIAHESDLSPGLANRMSFPFVKTICVTFDKGRDFFKNPDKVLVTGTPLRRSIMNGDKQRALSLCQFKEPKPTLLVIGGSLGSQIINKQVRVNLDALLKSFNVIHICGPKQVDSSITDLGYRQFEYVHDELAHFLALADLVLSRAGANMIYELLRLAKPSLLVPLSRRASRGDQIENAAYFESMGYAKVLHEEALEGPALMLALQDCLSELPEWQARLSRVQLQDSNQVIISEIGKYLNAVIKVRLKSSSSAEG